MNRINQTDQSRECSACPRRCGVDRNQQPGFCGMPAEIRLAKAALHPWEEPCISGKNGSGALFFCGCNLRCVFCQNRPISQGELTGTPVSPEKLRELMLRLRDEGACSINLVTPTHYAPALAPVLREVRPALGIPVVYNCGGYESVETLRMLEGLIDIYLPDCKYFDAGLSGRYSSAPDYFPVARDALREMLRQTGRPVFSADGTLLRGVMVRHLVLPGCRHDSIRLLEELCGTFGSSAFLLSLMSQYSPEFAPETADANLRRRLTSFEYSSVLNAARQLGFSGYMQMRSASGTAYTPDFRNATF